MRLLLIHQAFASMNEPGGTRHHELARYLASQGHQISIIASPISYLTGKNTGSGRVETDMNGKISIYRTYTYPALHRSFIHRLISFFSFMASSFFTAIKIKDVDIIWGTSPPIFQSFTAWLVSAFKRVPFLFEIRDLWPEFAIAVGVLKNKLLIKLSLWLEKFLYRRADKIMVNSPGYIKHIKNKGGKDITLIPNSADVSFFSPDDHVQLRRKLGWEDKFIVLYAGAHGMSNDLQTLIQAANILSDQPEIKIVCIGDGKEKQNLITLVNSLSLKNVEFIDPVSKNQIAGYLYAADICTAILKPIEMYKTTYPNKVFDYMAVGKPILLAIDGVIREVVETSGCGKFCTPGNPQAIADGITDMFKHRSDLKTMGEKGRVYLIEHFDRTKIANTFSDMINNLVSTHVSKETNH